MLLLALWPWSGSSVSPVSRFLQWGAVRIPWHTLTKPRAWHIGRFNISTFLFPSLFLSLFYIVFCETKLNSRSSKVTSEVMLSCLFKNKNQYWRDFPWWHQVNKLSNMDSNQNKNNFTFCTITWFQDVLFWPLAPCLSFCISSMTFLASFINKCLLNIQLIRSRGNFRTFERPRH